MAQTGTTIIDWIRGFNTGVLQTMFIIQKKVRYFEARKACADCCFGLIRIMRLEAQPRICCDCVRICQTSRFPFQKPRQRGDIWAVT